MHDFRKIRIIMWDIGKNKPNISSSNIWKLEDISHLPEPKREDLPFNDCEFYYLEFI